ncbi:unnamed protein product [Closterium sp. Yama58-4]|nr:unnamed protein product [Closterium sp. Yama58-4]
MSTARVALAAALLTCFVALLVAPPGASATAQTAFLVAKANKLRAAADQAAADLKTAQADAAKNAEEAAAAEQALSDLQSPEDAALNDLVTSVSNTNESVSDAQYDLDIANKVLALRMADLAAFKADPSKHPQIPAAQKAVSDATRRAKMTSALLQEWHLVVQEAAQSEADAEKALKENPDSPAAEAALAEAQVLRKSVEEVFPDMVAQDQRAQARLERMQKELNDLITLGPQGETVFQVAVDDARAAVSVARQVYDDLLAAVTDAQKAVDDYQANKQKAVIEAKARLAKAKQSQAVADKKVIQLTDKLKAALVQADNAEKAAGISKIA